jgi:uncharacterized membrane protein YphA (DoxX/SURF4 family)
MGIALWVVQVLVAAAFLVSGATKLSQPKEKLLKNMAWVEDFSQPTLRIIGALEVLGAIGIVLPALTGIVPWLTPLAALGLVLTMIGAALTHLRRTEPGKAPRASSRPGNSRSCYSPPGASPTST